MRHSRIREFEDLYERYANAETRDEKLIKHRLDAIRSLYADCAPEERAFADEITKEFCRLLALVQEQNAREWDEALGREYEEVSLSDFTSALSGNTGWSAFVPAQREPIQPNPVEFQDAQQLLDAFGDYLSERTYGNGKRVSPLTINDYKARISTFAKRYLVEIPDVNAMWEEEEACLTAQCWDPVLICKSMKVLFVYRHLEQILKRFDTKDEKGAHIKQKENMRAALRKLFEFKLSREDK